MRRASYLNGILTANAVLLAGLLWTQIAGQPLLSSTAAAQNITPARPVPTVPNAGKQRRELIDAIHQLRRTTQESMRLLTSGRVKVEVTNLDEIKIAAGTG